MFLDYHLSVPNRTQSFRKWICLGPQVLCSEYLPSLWDEVLTLMTLTRKMLSANLVWNTDYAESDFSWISSVPWLKCQHSTFHILFSFFLMFIDSVIKDLKANYILSILQGQKSSNMFCNILSSDSSIIYLCLL